MGYPLGPTLANALLCHYEKKWLDSCPVEFRPKLYKRYDDDIFLMFQFRDMSESLLIIWIQNTPIWVLHLKQKIKIVFHS